MTGRRRALRAVLPLTLLAGAALLAAEPAAAQEITLSLGEDGSLAAQSIQLLLLVTVLSLVPGIAVTITCFPFLVTVLSILRQGLGLQQSPPNMLLVSLALFLTWYVMDPVFRAAWDGGVQPLIDGDLALEAAFGATMDPFRGFMANRVDPATLEAMAALRPATPDATAAEMPLAVLVPSFLLSEIARAFEIGFLVFLPFLVIDLVVAAVLMSMGMMMVPPAIVALPFKLAFFVLADGWSLIAESLVRSYM